MEKRDALLELNREFAKRCQCTLRRTATQAVPGDGNPDADIIFIGEAPGKNEDREGRPFVGAAGKFLNEMLASANLSREDIYITNIVKYRPPDNRDPLPEEIESCRQWLAAELRLIEPKVIVTLGRHALGHFVPRAKISEVHGTAFRQDVPGLGVRVIFALYHPAAALYNGSMRQTLIDDFKKVPAILDELSAPLP